MKINHKVLSIPPHISTSWKNISSIQVVEKENSSILLVNLNSGQAIEIPGLGAEMVEKIFEAHTAYLEKESSTTGEGSFNFGLPIKFGAESFENIGSVMQHNPAQAGMPDLPPEILEKVSNLSQAFGIDHSSESLPKAEPHCNCMFCQVARALNKESSNDESDDEELDEEIKDIDLTFRDWDINQTNDKVYIVTNPFNAQEHYQVYLGNPIGCTCGQKNCEHVRAVLNS